MSGIALAIGASAVIGAGVSIYSANKASSAQQEAAGTATGAELQMYYQSREDLEPWRKTGTAALEKVSKLIEAGPGEYTKSPGYEFRLKEGVNALERGASAKGMLDSGAEKKALVKFGQDYATNDYDNFLDRFYKSLNPLLSLSGVGQVATGQQVQANTQTGQQIGQNALLSGQGRASGYINQANAITGAVNSGTQNYLMYNLLKTPAKAA